MSPKRKSKQPAVKNSIRGGVKGIGNVVGNNSKSNVSISMARENTSTIQKSSNQLLWIRLFAFLITFAGILAIIASFLQLLQTFEISALIELVLAGLISALGVSGILKPKMLVDLFEKIVGKK